MGAGLETTSQVADCFRIDRRRSARRNPRLLIGPYLAVPADIL
jgi:hypothetical protein